VDEGLQKELGARGLTTRTLHPVSVGNLQKTRLVGKVAPPPVKMKYALGWRYFTVIKSKNQRKPREWV